VQHQQPLGDVDAAIGVDADQVIVESGVMERAMRLATTGGPSSSWASAMMWAASSR
jgi:hypothetical protein